VVEYFSSCNLQSPLKTIVIILLTFINKMVDIFAFQMVKKQRMSKGEMPVGNIAAILPFF